MRTLRSVHAVQRLARRWRREGRQVALVPTMGYLHGGHLSLVERARGMVGKRGIVVVSVYVNPAQFGPREDLARYPRDLKRDLRLCHAAAVDVVFAPSNAEMYPRHGDNPSSTFVVEEELSRGMEGASRPTHFRGVATVVAKLFNIVQPGISVFGAKDFQQAAIVKRMVDDLHYPMRIVVAPIFRERDGLAMSSRNKYLAGDLRRQALVLWRCIQLVRAAVRRSRGPIPAARLKGQVKRLIRKHPQARLDYVEFFNSETLLPASRVGRGIHMALAVFIAKTRLIDNARL